MNALRLLFGTLTVIPVKPPTSLDRRTAGWAMTLAPLAGLVLAVIVVVPILLVQERDLPVSPLLMAVLVLGTLAMLTRVIHLDGLADTVDGLGSRRHGDEAIAIMKRSDIGPFGVVALVLVLLTQTAALAQCLLVGSGSAAVVVALLVSRGLLPVICTPAFPAARTDGLGSVVAGSVSAARAVLGVLLAGLLVVVALEALVAGDWVVGEEALQIGLTAVFAVPTGLVLARQALIRFDGVTGDVYGACVEVTFTASLVLAALTA